MGEFSYGKEANYSEATAELIDQEVKGIIMRNYGRVKSLLEERRELLEEIAELLLDKETLEGEEFRAMLQERREGSRAALP